MATGNHFNFLTIFFHKMAARSAILDVTKNQFDDAYWSRQLRETKALACGSDGILDDGENYFWSAFLGPFQINARTFIFWEIVFALMATGGHFGWPKLTFDRISRHFRSIRNFFWFLFSKWIPIFSQNRSRPPSYSISVATSNHEVNTQHFLIKL